MTAIQLCNRLSLAAVLALTGCGASKIAAAPPPLRPEPKGEPENTSGPVRTDCEPAVASEDNPALRYNERSIDEAQDQANSGLLALREAENGDTPQQIREQKITEAVSFFIASLQSDPYNVTATYNLAAAYARINRRQCSLNMLERILDMRTHSSRKVEVSKALDRLLGRGTATIDPDFNDMRTDERFRSLIRNMCAGSSDPGCVRGR